MVSNSNRWVLLLLVGLTVAIALPQIATARFGWGGSLSRQFAVDRNGITDTLYVVGRDDGDPGNGHGKDENVLWAFCTTDDCDNERWVRDRTLASDNFFLACEAPCKWAAKTDSLQNEKMGAPIVVQKSKLEQNPNTEGHYIVFGTHAEEVYAFNEDGSRHWVYPDSAAGQNAVDEKTLDRGFYARVAEHEGVIYAVSWGRSTAQVQSHLHAIELHGANAGTVPNTNGFPLTIDGSFQSLFNIIVDEDPSLDRVYLGFEKAAGNADKQYLVAVSLAGEQCDDGSGTLVDPPCVLWRANYPKEIDESPSSAGVRLGGLIHGNKLLATMKNGITAVDKNTGEFLSYYDSTYGETPWGADPATNTCDPTLAGAQCGDPQYIKQTHRAFPAFSQTTRVFGAGDPAQTGPLAEYVYVGQRGSGACGAGAAVYQLNPATGAIVNPGFAAIDDEPLFPRCGGKKLPNVSYSSPVVSERTGNIFLGGAKGNDPIYRIDPANIQHNDDANAGEAYNYSKLGWFDYAPGNGWRTDVEFTSRNNRGLPGNGQMLHIGSALGVVYGIVNEEGCGVVDWCYDTRSNEGGYCEVATCENPQNGSVLKPCCEMLRDDKADTAELECRRMADTCKTCWDGNEKPLADCNSAATTFTRPRRDLGGSNGLQNIADHEEISFADIYSADKTSYQAAAGGQPATPATVTFKIDWAPTGGGTEQWVEGMNLTNGEYLRFGTYLTTDDLMTVELTECLDNEFRFAVLDQHGNEFPAALTITNVGGDCS